MNAEDFNKIEWNKIFMSIAVAIVFIFQAYSQMQHQETKQDIKAIQKEVVPRTEVEKTYVPEHEIAKIDNRLMKELELLRIAIEKIGEK